MDKTRIINDERYYENMLREAAADICGDLSIRLVLVAGGSCSGKTTTTKKLGALLDQGGRKTYSVSLDDFYRNQEDSVYLPDKRKDIESLNSLEVGLIKKCLNDLCEGREADVPRFDFITQRRQEKYRTIKLEKTDVALIEGLHAFNPALFEGMRLHEHYNTYKIYLYTSDAKGGDPRFLRRLVRDYNYRGADAKMTFDQWDTVKENEPIFIDCYSGSANMKINTFFPYEKNILCRTAVRVLEELPEGDRHFPVAVRMCEELRGIRHISYSHVPDDSLIHEFINKDNYTD